MHYGIHQTGKLRQHFYRFNLIPYLMLNFSKAIFCFIDFVAFRCMQQKKKTKKHGKFLFIIEDGKNHNMHDKRWLKLSTLPLLISIFIIYHLSFQLGIYPNKNEETQQKSTKCQFELKEEKKEMILCKQTKRNIECCLVNVLRYIAVKREGKQCIVIILDTLMSLIFFSFFDFFFLLLFYFGKYIFQLYCV